MKKVLAQDQIDALREAGVFCEWTLYGLLGILPKYLKRRESKNSPVFAQRLNIYFSPAKRENGELDESYPGKWRVGYGKNGRDMAEGEELIDALCSAVLLQARKRNTEHRKRIYVSEMIEKMNKIANDKDLPEDQRVKAFYAKVRYEKMSRTHDRRGFMYDKVFDTEE